MYGQNGYRQACAASQSPYGFSPDLDANTAAVTLTAEQLESHNRLTASVLIWTATLALQFVLKGWRESQSPYGFSPDLDCAKNGARIGTLTIGHNRLTASVLIWTSAMPNAGTLLLRPSQSPYGFSPDLDVRASQVHNNKFCLCHNRLTASVLIWTPQMAMYWYWRSVTIALRLQS